MSHRIDLDQVLCRGEGIYKLIKRDPTVPDEVLNILGIEPDNSSCDKYKVVVGKATSLPVPIANGHDLAERARRTTDSSQTSSSLNNSSSVEVLSEAEENKFEDALTTNYF